MFAIDYTDASMNLSGVLGLIQHGITTDQSEPSFRRIFSFVLITVVLLSVLIPVLIVLIRRFRERR
jgi:uncharacterized membrane protein YhaH (DUF805 family)